MTITRIIDGKAIEITLTPDEVRTTFLEKQHEYDVEDVKNFFKDMADEDVRKNYGCNSEEVEDQFEEIAIEMRRNMDRYSMDWQTAISSAVYMILEYRRNKY